MKKNHYDILGVARNATHPEVKKAFQRAASHNHPDKGGSPEAMAEINKAWAVLGDPVRRQHYDSSGADELPVDPPDAARGQLIEMFAAALEREGNIVSHVKKMLAKDNSQMGLRESSLQLEETALKRRRAKVRCKSTKPNLVHMIIDNRLEKLKAALVEIQRRQAVNKEVEKLIEEYESSEEERQREPGDVMTIFFTNHSAR
jgi:curved DNA-binding protein CbpA